MRFLLRFLPSILMTEHPVQVRGALDVVDLQNITGVVICPLPCWAPGGPRLVDALSPQLHLLDVDTVGVLVVEVLLGLLCTEVHPDLSMLTYLKVLLTL